MAVVLAAALPLAACESEQAKTCEQSLIADLKSPASYKRVAVKEFDNPSYKIPYHEVEIIYDAANSYNALLRDKRTCWYKPGTTDHVDPFGFDSIGVTDMNAVDMNATEMSATDISAASDAAVEAADAATDDARAAVNEARNAIGGGDEGEGAEDLNTAPDDY